MSNPNNISEMLRVLGNIVESKDAKVEDLTPEQRDELRKVVSPLHLQLEANGASSTFLDRIKQLDMATLTTRPKKLEWLLRRPGEKQGDGDQGVLPMGRVGILAAAGGVGKTMALVQLALGVATNRGWLGLFTTPKPGHVLVALGEEDQDEIHRRIYNACNLLNLNEAEKNKAIEHIHILPLCGVPCALTELDRQGNVTDTPLLYQMREYLEKAGFDWRLLIFDPLSRWAGPDIETSNTGATRFIQAVESLTMAPGNPSALIAHHTTKAARKEGNNDSTIARGATGLVDGARWVATMTTELEAPAYVRFSNSKSNYSPLGKDFLLMKSNQHGGALRSVNQAETQAYYDEIAELRKSKKKNTKQNGQAPDDVKQSPSEMEDYS